MIKPTSVTDRLSIGVPPPERGGVGPAVGAAGPLPLGGGLNMTCYTEKANTKHYSPGDVWVWQEAGWFRSFYSRDHKHYRDNDRCHLASTAEWTWPRSWHTRDPLQWKEQWELFEVLTFADREKSRKLNSHVERLRESLKLEAESEDKGLLCPFPREKEGDKLKLTRATFLLWLLSVYKLRVAGCGCWIVGVVVTGTLREVPVTFRIGLARAGFISAIRE